MLPLSYFSYLKKESFTGLDILKLQHKLNVYQNRFDNIVLTNNYFLPEKKDIEAVSFAVPRSQVALQVNSMITNEFKIRNNTKYMERVFKGGKMYLIANDIDAMQRFCEWNYNFGKFEDREVYEKKRDYFNLLSPEYNKTLLYNWGMLSEGLSEILYILFDRHYDMYTYDKEEHIRFISELKNCE